MTDIFNSAGEKIADIPLSFKQRKALEEGEEISIIFHTPQLLKGLLGQHNGSFSLHSADGRIVTKEPQAVSAYANLQKAITSTRARGN